MIITNRVIPFVCCCFTVLSVTPLYSASIVVNLDASFEGLATSGQTPFTGGMIKLGWFDPVSDAVIRSSFASGNVASIDALFHVVATVSDLSSFGPGLPFQMITILDSPDESSLNAYRSTLAGKQIYTWVVSDISGSATISLEQIILKSDIVFPLAQDDLTFSDYAATFGTDSFSPGVSAIIGNIAAVVIGSDVDTNAGSPQDGLGLNGGDKVLQSAAVTFVPEPTSNLLVLVGSMLAVVFRRRR